MFRKLCSFFVLFFLVFTSTWASHIVGGEFALVWKGRGYNYQLSLNVYFDDIHAESGLINNDLVINVYVFEKASNNQVEVFQLPRVSAKELVEYQIPDCQTGQLRTRILRYSSSIFLDPAKYNHPDGYYLVWERCCRNEIIDNIMTPDNVGNAFYLEFPPVHKDNNRFINSSPQFNDIKGEYFCLDSDQVFDFGATDSNGDSLVFSLVVPYAGHGSLSPGGGGAAPEGYPAPYPPVQWKPGFSATTAIPGTLKIDQQTGQLFVNPSMEGLFVLTVMVEEYRDGVRIGLTRRDFQFMVIKCPKNPPPFARVEMPGGGYYNQNDTVVVDYGKDSCFVVEATDSSAYFESEKIGVRFISGNPQGILSLSLGSGTVNASNPKITGPLCISTCNKLNLQQDTLIPVQIVVNDDGCPVPKTDTLFFNILIRADTNKAPLVGVIPDIDNYALTVSLMDSVSFDVFSTDQDSLDIIHLNMEGVGFNAADAGMVFSPVSGTDSIASRFSWKVNCDHLKPGTYTVNFKSRDESCYQQNVAEKQVTFTIGDKTTEITTIEPINLITPNSDDFNDCFYIPDMPEGNCQYFFARINIFNRWGAEVFKSEDPYFRWCASDVADGIYFYVIDLNDKVFRGWIQVIR